MVCVFGYYFFFLSVFNIVGDELDKLGVEFFEGGVLMDYKLFFDFVIVFKIYRGYIVKGIYMLNLMFCFVFKMFI